jgi:hypothetical protein
LAARRADLQTKKLEHRRAVRRGDLVELTRTGRLVERRFREIRARALALPTKTAPLFAAADEDRALAILRKEIAGVLESLQHPLLEDLPQ